MQFMKFVLGFVHISVGLIQKKKKIHVVFVYPKCLQYPFSSFWITDIPDLPIHVYCIYFYLVKIMHTTIEPS
jgi:hypothetical protein